MVAWRGAIVDVSHIFRDLLQENLRSFGFEVVFCEKSISSLISLVTEQQDTVDFILWHSPPNSDMSDELILVRDFHLRQPNVGIFLLADLPNQDRGVWQAPADISYVGIARVLSRDIPSAALKYMLTLLMMERQSLRPAGNGGTAPPGVNPMPRALDEHRPGRAISPNALASCPRTPDADEPWPPHEKRLGLSDREQQILSCLVQGQANKAIARMLNITEGTVKVHVKSLLRKIKVRNRTQAAIWALDRSTDVRNTHISASLDVDGPPPPRSTGRDLRQDAGPRLADSGAPPH